MRKLILALMLAQLAATGCDSAATEEPAERTGQVAGEETSAEKEIDSSTATAASEDCQTYFSEVAQTCHDSFFEGLKISCHTAFISAEVALAQMEGNLFTDPAGNVSAQKIGEANCAANVRSLRKKRDKAEVEAKKDWGPQCTDYFLRLESACVTPIAQGVFGESCGSALMMVNNIKRNPEPEDLCQSFAQLIRN
jgi:hypothetical protein